MSDRILNIENLKVSFDTYAGEVQAVRGVSFYVDRGETLAIVGESGCGKSVTVQTIMKLIPMPPGRLKEGLIEYCGRNIASFSDKKMESLRGKEMSMIFQDPMTSLNPTMRVGRQILEGLKKHNKVIKNEAEKQIIKILKDVGIPNPDKNMLRYPHMFSGGMRQRVMISIALACNPKILFADEPTTALDVTTQAQILELMNDLKEKLGTSIVLITHDLGIVARMADRVAVMYAGKIVETGSTNDIFYSPKHPYTVGLLKSLPKVDAAKHKPLEIIPGTPSSLIDPPQGCAFAPRCKYSMNICRRAEPPESKIKEGHFSSCWLLDDRAPKVEFIKEGI
ncbi:MAG: ABC transporter ATP-binding protein [Tissierellia bacterium]|nr:ABC transporter ATP-binding protein [Tissierellia bacterium]